ncbi:MAG: helix-turn-helix transcriptional regulator [Acidimicrobiales bacterium]
MPTSAVLAVGLGEPSIGARIREARQARGWSMGACARRFVAIRTEAGERLDAANIRSQWSNWERGIHAPDRLSQTTIAQVFGVPVEAIFGLTTERNLPRPILVEAHVTPETIGLLRRQRGVHAEAEHSLGPQFAKVLVGIDLVTIEALVRLTPEALSPQVHAVAASVAELGGWIAQECGVRAKALELTLRAFEYAEESGDSSLEAMILMRRSNLVAPVDPRRGAKLADRAAELVQRSAPSRLHATIARQRAPRLHSQRDGRRAHRVGRSRSCGHPAGGPGPGAGPGQERDHAVALARWLQALVDSGDHRSAAEHTVRILMAYQRAPSQRARLALRATLDKRDGGKELRDLQNHIARVLDGVARS